MKIITKDGIKMFEPLNLKQGGPNNMNRDIWNDNNVFDFTGWAKLGRRN